MLHCESNHAAMQTNELWLASGIPMLVTRYLPLQENDMSKTASVAIAPSTSLFGRLLSIIDRVLMTNAEIAHRNGDVPYFGL
jgi:hypothetical protein